MDDKSRKLLQWFADGHHLLTEYDDDETWKTALALRQAGLLEGRQIITGTVGFTITPAGTKALQEKE